VIGYDGPHRSGNTGVYDMSSETNQLMSKEARVLRAMRKTLTGIIKDTATEPGLKHPLSNDTIEDIRHCLGLIAAREQELLKEAGVDNNMRPHFIDEPGAGDSTVVPISSIGRNKKPDS
jgi:hypothetical protein